MVAEKISIEVKEIASPVEIIMPWVKLTNGFYVPVHLLST